MDMFRIPGQILSSSLPSLVTDFECFPVAAQSSSSSDESNDDDKDSKSEDESDSSDDTFVKDNYYSSSSVWRSYTTRGQVKGNKEGEQAASWTGTISLVFNRIYEAEVFVL